MWMESQNTEKYTFSQISIYCTCGHIQVPRDLGEEKNKKKQKQTHNPYFFYGHGLKGFLWSPPVSGKKKKYRHV